MANVQASRFLTLLQREFREYKNSMFWTPVITAGVLIVLMLGSVVLANRVAGIGDTILEALMREDSSSVSVSISVGEDTEEVTVISVDDVDNDMAISPPPAPAAPLPYEVVVGDEGADDQWNFSREWTFNPESANGDEVDEDLDEMSGRELNVMLGVVHGILLLILLLTTVNYLLSSLYDDRKDRSILFWRSMPVTELENVLSKFVMALLVAPLIYIAVSLVLQLAYVLLMMLLVWRMDRDPFAVVVDNIDFVALMTDPISGWVMTALLIAPTYAWFLCASSLAKRSPMLMAVLPLVALFFIEGLVFGTEYIGDAVQRHVPHVSESSSVGFYLFGPDWSAMDLGSAGAGLVFAALAIAATIWLRKHRWELN